MASRMRGAAELIDLSMLETQILGLTYANFRSRAVAIGLVGVTEILPGIG